MKNRLVSFGKILNFHGIKGEIKLAYSRGREDFVAGLKDVYVQTPEGDFAIEGCKVKSIWGKDIQEYLLKSYEYELIG